MFKVIKNGYNIDINPNSRGLITTLSRDDSEQKYNFGLIKPGQVLILLDNEWKPMDTSTLTSGKIYRDELDKASTDLGTILTRYPIGDKILIFDFKQKEFMDAVIYDLIELGELEWLPDVHKVELLNKKFKITYDGGREEIREYQTDYPPPQQYEEDTEDDVSTEEYVDENEEEEELDAEDLIEVTPELLGNNLQVPSPKGVSPKMPLTTSPRESTNNWDNYFDEEESSEDTLDLNSLPTIPSLE